MVIISNINMNRLVFSVVGIEGYLSTKFGFFGMVLIPITHFPVEDLHYFSKSV